MLNELLDSNSGSRIETGIVAENMLDGYFRVEINGTIYTARNQSEKPLVAGALVSVVSTTWGRFIVSSAARQAADIPTVIIRG